jgi:hypothetical protein
MAFLGALLVTDWLQQPTMTLTQAQEHFSFPGIGGVRFKNVQLSHALLSHNYHGDTVPLPNWVDKELEDSYVAVMAEVSQVV